MASNPRLLQEITEYRNLLDERDEAQGVKTALDGLTNDEAIAGLNITANVALRVGTASVASAAFNKHLANYLKKNMKAAIARAVMDSIDDDIVDNLAEAETEAGLLGITSTPVASPSITSAATDTATIGGSYTYTITATGISGTGITSVNYSVTNNPTWLTLATDGTLSGTVPSTETDGSSFTMTVTVTTNVGSDSKDVTVTYAS